MADYPCRVTLDILLSEFLPLCGYDPTEYDVSQVADIEVLGFTHGQRQAGGDSLDPMLAFYGVDYAEIDGKVVFVKRGGSVQGTINVKDTGAYRWPGSQSHENSGFVEVAWPQDLELPYELDLSYYSFDLNYEINSQPAQILEATHVQQPQMTTVPLTLTDAEARRGAFSALYTIWAERKQVSVSLPWKYLKYTPTDVVLVPVRDELWRCRIVQEDIPLWGPLTLRLVPDDPSIWSQNIAATQGLSPLIQNFVTESLTLFWSGNALRDEDAASIGFYGMAVPARSGNWLGFDLYMSRDQGMTFQALDSYHIPGVIGQAETALPDYDTTGWWDLTHSLDVVMESDTALESISDAELFAGGNTALLGDEVLQFGQVVILGDVPKRYRLSRFLRGRRGTDGHWTEHTEGERFALLAPTWTHRYVLDDSLRGATVLLAPVPPGVALANVVSVPLTITGDERKPYAPCEVRGTRETNDNVTITWLRRARSGGEMAPFVDVAQPEPTLSFDVEILANNGSVLRTFSGVTSPLTYTSAQQVSDWGGSPVSFDAIIYQIGLYGRGYPSRATLPKIAAAPSSGARSAANLLLFA